MVPEPHPPVDAILLAAEFPEPDSATLRDAEGLMQALAQARDEIARLERAVSQGATIGSLASMDRYLSRVCVAAGRISGQAPALRRGLEQTLDALDALIFRLRAVGPPLARTAPRSPVAAAAAYAQRSRDAGDE